jgi:hypothetical protein
VKPASFVPQVAAISPGEAARVPGLEETISYWTEATRSSEEWFRELSERWGTGGFVVRRGEETLGFVVYGPSEHLPRAGRYPLGPLDEEAALLACVCGDPRTRRRLLVRMLRDLKQRGASRAEAIASDSGLPHHVPTQVLLESGWRPIRRAPYRRNFYTLVRTDLGSAVEVGEMARALIGRVKLPGLKKSVPAPGGALPHVSHAAGAQQGGR